MRSVDDVINEFRREIIKLDGVLDVCPGMHLGRICIMVYLDKNNPAIQQEISRYIEGHPVRFVVSDTMEVY